MSLTWGTKKPADRNRRAGTYGPSVHLGFRRYFGSRIFLCEFFEGDGDSFQRIM